MKRREIGPATVHTHACGEGGIFVNADPIARELNGGR
jgi:hypothetical protein